MGKSPRELENSRVHTSRRLDDRYYHIHSTLRERSNPARKETLMRRTFLVGRLTRRTAEILVLKARDGRIDPSGVVKTLVQRPPPVRGSGLCVTETETVH